MRELAHHLVSWFAANKRRLPWRTEPRDPYHVLVSELMLQQTQVDRVVPRFESFVATFPSLEELADAGEEEVLAAWSGLGYYRRARLLHAAARAVVAEGGTLPDELSALQNLPGIGPYTAAAVASLAFGRAAPVLDGNVMRVVARCLALDGDARKAAASRRLNAWVAALMEHAAPAAVNEALMELGAVVCTPRAPGCDRCPIRSGCRAAELGIAEELPSPRRQRAAEELSWVAACCVDAHGRWLLHRVDEGPILRGLWLPPIAELNEGDEAAVVARALVPIEASGEGVNAVAVRHSITHRRITVHPALFELRSVQLPGDGWRLADPSGTELATSSLLAKLTHAVALLRG